MRDTYFIYDEAAGALSNICVLPLVIEEGVNYLVTAVQSNRKSRGKGRIKQLLAELCGDADREGATLCLSVDPSSDETIRMDINRLVKLYETFGFELRPELAGENPAMVRIPKVAAEV